MKIINPILLGIYFIIAIGFFVIPLTINILGPEGALGYVDTPEEEMREMLMSYVVYPLGLIAGIAAYIKSKKMLIVKLIPFAILNVVMWYSSLPSQCTGECWNSVFALATTLATGAYVIVQLIATAIANRYSKTGI